MWNLEVEKLVCGIKIYLEYRYKWDLRVVKKVLVTLRIFREGWRDR